MNERISELATQARDVWNSMSTARRWTLLGAAGGVFLVLIFLAFGLTGSSGREVLFSGLSGADAAEVLQFLDERGIPYHLSQDSTGKAAISVPKDLVYRTRIDLAAEGVPRQGSVGFEIFSENQLGMTDDVRRINLRRALNGELERTIRSLDVVESVKVQVALPESSLFISQQKQPTAAVMITLRPGMRMGPEQVSAVQKLVGSTVEGLRPEDVFVVDNHGNPLSDQLSQLSQRGDLDSVEQQLLIRQAIGNEYSRQIRSLLEGPFGAGRVEAMVSVELNFQRAEEIVRSFEAPDGRSGLPRSEQLLEETFSGVGSTPGGVPGVESNIPGFPGVGSDTESEFSRIEEIINYELNETETRRIIPPGAIRRMTVAVLIDGELSSEQEAAVSNIIQTALGLESERGDQISVASMPFATLPVLSDAVAVSPVTSGPPGLYAIALGSLLLFLLIVFLIARRRRRAEQAAIDVIVDDNNEEQGILARREPSLEERRREQMREEIAAMAQRNPQDVANLLKSWLTEE